MNAWITRLLGGAACTVGVLALGMGVAQADVTNVLADASAKVAAGSHTAKVVVKKATPRLNKVPVGSRTGLTARVGKATASSSSRTGRTASVAANANPTRHRTLAARVNAGSRGGGVTATGSSTRARKAATVKAEVKANRTPRHTVVPAVVGDVNATAMDLPIAICGRVNAGDCGGSGSSGGGNSDQLSALADLIPPVVADNSATAADLADADSCIRVNAGDCGSSGSGSTDQSSALAGLIPTDVADLIPTEVADTTPAVVADTTASAADLADLDSCIRINAGDCTSSGGSGGGSQPPVANLIPPVVADTTATATDVAGLDSCIRVNAGDCTNTGGGTTSRRALLAGLTPAVVADTTATAAGLADLDSCIRVNGGDCTTSGGSGTGSGGSSDPTLAADLIPAVVADTTAAAAGLADLDSCIRINAGDCGGTGSTSQPTAGLVASVLGDLTATAGDAAAQGMVCIGINAVCGDTSTGGGSGGGTGGGGTGGATGGDGGATGGAGIGSGSGVGSAIDNGIGGSVGSRAGVLAASLFVVPLGGPGSGALASTGVSARMVGVLVAGLLSLLMALPMLRRRRNG